MLQEDWDARRMQEECVAGMQEERNQSSRFEHSVWVVNAYLLGEPSEDKLGHVCA
jgi:hypothetical protein